MRLFYLSAAVGQSGKSVLTSGKKFRKFEKAPQNLNQNEALSRTGVTENLSIMQRHATSTNLNSMRNFRSLKYIDG